MTRLARTTGELTELYAYGRFRKLFHPLNALWFKLRGPPSLAIGNYLVFRKSEGGYQDPGGYDPKSEVEPIGLIREI